MSYLRVVIYLGSIFVLASIVVGVWIYNAMIIDVKCFDIILWFLDIPVLYVGYLQANCNTYIKSHTPVNELIDKGINFHDRNLYLEDYASGPQLSDDKFNEESKGRKIMIARYKKKTLLSRCDCGYIQLFWLLFYSLLFSVIYIVVLHQEITFYHFLSLEWQVTARQLLWSTTIPNALRLITDHNTTKIGTLNFTAFEASLQNKFLNPVDSQALGQTYRDLLAYGISISAYYQSIFEGDICGLAMYSAAEAVDCRAQMSGRLEGGINSVFTYYATLDPAKYVELEKVQFDYVNVQLLRLFGIWEKAFTDSVKGSSSLLTMCLALYLILTLSGFVLMWTFYLNKMNLRLNQTIQMLNMIPMKMLPKGRKDIRDFFNWIIKEANKNRPDG